MISGTLSFRHGPEMKRDIPPIFEMSFRSFIHSLKVTLSLP
jgi:hypothetical protein